MPKSQNVNDMFGGIASQYDCANRLLSFGMDASWRRQLVRSALHNSPQRICDLATGTGDVAFTLAKIASKKNPAYPGGLKIIGLDFCQPMIEKAKLKQKGLPHSMPNITFALGDCMNLPLASHSMDAVTLSFGLRNFEDRAKGLAEIRRILRPGGSLNILEFSQPFPWIRPLYYFYLKKILPKIAKQATGNQEAYEYLVGSIESFPSRQALAEELLNAGFKKVTSSPLTFGTVALHRGLN